MSLVYPAHDAGAPRPMTHVLLVGVGQYLHLPGGPLYAQKKAKYALGLRQLTSPPVSAQRLANWMITKLTTTHKNPAAPLGSVELLLSPTTWTDPQGNAQQVDAATFDNLRQAFGDWLHRCDRHADNIGIFYFCGHGFEWDKTYLLPSDYGADRGNPWDQVIDFDQSRWGFLGDAKAKTMCSLIDACREVKIDALTNVGFKGRPLWTASAPPAGDRDAPTLKAAKFGEQAHGPPNGVSYFADALMRCLERLGAAGPPQAGKWRVTTNSLSLAMKQLMARTIIPNVGPGACQAGGESNTPGPTTLHGLPGAADVLAEISYMPEAALNYAELSYCPAGQHAQKQARARMPQPWQIEVVAGAYDVAAVFQNAEYADRHSKGQVIYPPFTACVLEGEASP